LVGLRGIHVHPAHVTLVAIGLGTRMAALDAGVIVAAVLSLLVAASFWLAYFDYFTIRAQQLLSDRSGATRTAPARDA
jgi:low temperature requirement protein LtrA